MQTHLIGTGTEIATQLAEHIEMRPIRLGHDLLELRGLLVGGDGGDGLDALHLGHSKLLLVSSIGDKLYTSIRVFKVNSHFTK